MGELITRLTFLCLVIMSIHIASKVDAIYNVVSSNKNSFQIPKNWHCTKVNAQHPIDKEDDCIQLTKEGFSK